MAEEAEETLVIENLEMQNSSPKHGSSKSEHPPRKVYETENCYSNGAAQNAKQVISGLISSTNVSWRAWRMTNLIS